MHDVDILEYGTSPRFPWLTAVGQRVRDFVMSKTDEELIEICTSRYEAWEICAPEFCNCFGNGRENVGTQNLCRNPFWAHKEL